MKYSLCISLLSLISVSSLVFDTLNDFPLDQNDRLDSHWLVHSNNPACENTVNRILSSGVQLVGRQIAAATDDLATILYRPAESFDPASYMNSCYLACLDLGAPYPYHVHVFPDKIYDATEYSREVNNFIRQSCQRIEVTIVSFNENPVHVFWLNEPLNEYKLVSTVDYGERHQVHQVTTIGHKFQARDSVTGDVLLDFEARHHGSIRVGGAGGTGVIPGGADFTDEIEASLADQLPAAHRVKRTFTSVGFGKARLPPDVFASMSAFYYNNREQFVREDWHAAKGYYVNWWEHDAYMLYMPWGLKVK